KSRSLPWDRFDSRIGTVTGPFLGTFRPVSARVSALAQASLSRRMFDSVSRTSADNQPQEAPPSQGRQGGNGKVSAFRKASRRFASTVALAIAALALSAPLAQAGPLADSATSCADQTYSQPFLPWADPASYTLAPNGSFEHGSGSWSLSGG